MLMTSTTRHSKLSSRLLAAAVLFLAGMVAAGCGDDKPKGPPPVHQFELNVSVTDENDAPVAKAPVLLDGKTVGFTDREGLFAAVINERAGAQIELAVGKMDDYIVPEDAAVVDTLRLTKSLEGQMKPSPVALQTRVRSAQKDYLVWLDVDCGKYLDSDKCQNLPVMHNDTEVARTDEHGQAHFTFSAVPGEKAQVSVKTPRYEPKPDDDEDDAFVMKPENPSYDIQLGLDSEVLQIKEEFNDPVAAERAKKRAKRRRSYRRRRRRRTTKKKKATQKKQKKDDGVIDLW